MCNSILKQYYGKAITNITAYGIDEFDFTPNRLGVDFSVGQYGYAVFEFGEQSLYVSVDGLSSTAPQKCNAHLLPVPEEIRQTFIGAVLQSITFADEVYNLQFEGMDILKGHIEPSNGYCDRDYFTLEFPWI
jgi:hypothetical protein